jgi:molybdenum cofactor cytidylyltransferase
MERGLKMRFGPVPLDQALDAVSAHSLRLGERVIKKGARLTTDDLAAIQSDGRTEIIVALKDEDDIGEDEAAEKLALAVSGHHIRRDQPTTGRNNLFADTAGVLRIHTDTVNRLNAVDEAVTFATLPDYRAVERGEMIATVKIIPFAVSDLVIDRALSEIGAEPLIEVKPFRKLKVAAVSTLLPGLKPSVVNKTLAVLEGRLAPANSTVDFDLRVPHEAKDVADAIKAAIADGADLVVVYGASAITDRRDVIPAAIELAGGRIEHFGMPVDPGNLMLVGEVEGHTVLGAPGCARSPKENGFDWVLQRVMAGIPVKRADLTSMGVGGLLMEIIQRGHPRDPHAGPQE